MDVRFGSGYFTYRRPQTVPFLLCLTVAAWLVSGVDAFVESAWLQCIGYFLLALSFSAVWRTACCGGVGSLGPDRAWMSGATFALVMTIVSGVVAAGHLTPLAWVSVPYAVGFMLVFCVPSFRLVAHKRPVGPRAGRTPSTYEELP